MADTKKVVRRTAAERKAAFEQVIADIEAKEIERAKKQLVAKNERLEKVVELCARYDKEQAELVTEIEALEALVNGGLEPEDVAEEVTTSILICAAD